VADTLSSKERVLAAIAWDDVDRIPVFASPGGVAAQLIGRKVNREFALDGEALANAQLAAWEQLGDDLISVHGYGSLVEAFGAKSVWPENDYPMFAGPIVVTHDDADALVVPDPYRDPFQIEVLRALQIVKSKVGDRVLVGGFVNGIFNLAGRLLGTESLMANLTRDPELVHKVCRKIVAAQVRYGETLVEAGAELIHIPDATSSPACISPRTYEQFALPYLTEAIQGFKRAGAIVSYHPCGGEYPILDLIGRTGADILHFSELVDLAVVQKVYVGRHAVAGTVDPASVLFLGSRADVDRHVADIVGRLQFQTGAIIQPGCGLSPNFPFQNIAAMVEAAHTHGTYRRAPAIHIPADAQPTLSARS
jgi:uroporphyrinogen decarboxylase